MSVPGQFCKIVIDQRTDMLDGEIRRRIFSDLGGIDGVMPLARKNRRELRAPGLLHGREDPQLVIHHHVVPGGMATLDGLEHLLLVQIDEHPAFDRIPDPRTLYLARLNTTSPSERITVGPQRRQ